MECPAAVNIRGEHFPCDWPVDENGRHDGWNHTSAPAHAVWTDDRNAPLSPPEFSAEALYDDGGPVCLPCRNGDHSAHQPTLADVCVGCACEVMR